LSYHMTEA